MGLHYEKSIEIQDKRVEIFRDIPKQLLDLRATYTDLTRLLRSNSIAYRWEFPQGLSFSFRGKKVRIKTAEDKEKLLSVHGEDLQKGIERPLGPGPPPVPIPVRPEEQEKEKTPPPPLNE